MAKQKISAREQVWTMFQAMTVRDIAKKLGVDRRTVQRWKNQDQQPKPQNEKKIAREASAVRRGTREIARSKREHYEPPKTTVPVRGKRQYVGAEVTKERFEELQRLKKTDRRHQYDLFRRLKDKRGKTHYFHYQDAGAVVFDVRRIREVDALNLVKSYRGSGASLVIIRRLKKDSVTTDGRVIAKKGEHVGSRLYSLDSGIFSDDERIMKIIRENSASGQLIYFRMVGGNFAR